MLPIGAHKNMLGKVGFGLDCATLPHDLDEA